MELGLAGRIAIVTGGASNIGRGISLALAAEGAIVHIADRDESQARRVAAADPVHLRAESVDVTDAAAVRELVERVADEHGALDVLVTSAGWTIDRLFLEKPREEWVREVDVNYWGFVNAARPALERMIAQGRGRVVAIASDAGRIGEWREAVYSGAKGAVISTCRALAREVGRNGVTVNVVCPGVVPARPEETGEASMWRGELGEIFTPEILERAAKSYPLRRLGTPEDVAAAVAFLASDRASYITGQTLSVDGGYVIA